MNKLLLTLCVIHQGDRVLLGMKKRGHGMGKWNGFGGKVESGENVEAAALREFREEAGIVPLDMRKLAVMTFDAVTDDKVMEVHLFKATQFAGEPTESEEMLPQWFALDEIPFDKMWLDDRHWFPLMLAGKTFTARFLFEGESRIVEQEIHEGVLA